MWLSNSRNSLDGSVVLQTLQGKQIDLVSEYKYLGIIIDDKLCLNSHINYLRQKLKKTLGFYLEISLHIIVHYIIEFPGLYLLFEGKCIGNY